MTAGTNVQFIKSSRQRNDTPNLEQGILTNGGKSLEDQLDLLDLLEGDDMAADAAPQVKLPPVRKARYNGCGTTVTQAQASASSVVTSSSCVIALQILRDEVIPACPWHVQAAFCLVLPCCGVEESVRRFRFMVPEELQPKLDRQLQTLDQAALMHYIAASAHSSANNSRNASGDGSFHSPDT
mmetsp:Transcript_45825/g.99699  ORF Transcript_45825/g.99699 Transcript_45825/m.99699 type:complete len:183 (-) Transcript_45825:451-999(-)